MRRLHIALATLALAVIGCEGSTSISGTVTFEGKPLEQGHISFFPVEGTADIRGAQITDGHFVIADMPSGKRRVLITVPPKMVARGAAGAGAVHFQAGPIPKDAEGNNQIIDVQAGEQNLEFHLRKGRS